ncbi:hypothetical protein K437DRAFT_255745 [Tilletiaria anomala UBC 951]|uniref:Amine oxidase domain-containing protein n=1 Tax=Tilletiaria anomala (strain ATCC 24038 / CBS 436.72 / UBC 951) TaxID=1037660 RepID=A0A066W1Z3_TILAU|nr:uncharacterized protein K437DRAFT_255745 [Tilletiaria anomala UBC 951]KDN47736.1 hypothetical protein K437DRAFT_255745 [Tilletiaria anomala UBC 951]
MLRASSLSGSEHRGSSHSSERAGRAKSPKRVAIIGSGLSGLMCAYTLANAAKDDAAASESEKRLPMFQVHIFEKAKSLGLDSNSILVKEPAGKRSIRVDVPMRSFNSGYYPELLSLYRQLGIAVEKSNFTYSFASLEPHATARTPSERRGAPVPDFIYNGHSGVHGFGMPSSLLKLLPSRATFRSPSKALSYVKSELPVAVWALRDYLALVLFFAMCYFQLLFYALFHHLLGHTRDPTHPLASRRLGEWSSSAHINTRFIDDVIIPLFSAVMTSQADSVRNAPAAEVLEYVACTFLRSHYTVQAGVHEVQKALSKPLSKESIHTGAQVFEVSDCASAVGVGGRTFSLLVRDVEGHLQLYEDFHHCIFATQASQSADFLRKYLQRSSSVDSGRDAIQTQQLRQMVQQLEQFRYEHSSVINHTDQSMMPPSKRDWRDLNLVSPSMLGVNGAAHTKELDDSDDDDNRSAPRGRTLSEGQTQTMATHLIAQDFPSPNGPQLLMQTTNALRGMTPRQETVLSISNFQRAIVTIEGKAAQKGLFDWVRQSEATSAVRKSSRQHRLMKLLRDPLGVRWQLRLGDLQGGWQRRLSTRQLRREVDGGGEAGGQLWVCGSWSPGIPLLEGCVRSARLVCEEIMRQEGI